jgi:hypothetical protein
LSRELAPIYAKSFINRFYLILLNSKILFDVTGLNFRGEKERTVDCWFIPGMLDSLRPLRVILLPICRLRLSVCLRGCCESREYVIMPLKRPGRKTKRIWRKNLTGLLQKIKLLSRSDQVSRVRTGVAAEAREAWLLFPVWALGIKSCSFLLYRLVAARRRTEGELRGVSSRKIGTSSHMIVLDKKMMY